MNGRAARRLKAGIAGLLALLVAWLLLAIIIRALGPERAPDGILSALFVLLLLAAPMFLVVRLLKRVGKSCADLLPTFLVMLVITTVLGLFAGPHAGWVPVAIAAIVVASLYFEYRRVRKLARLAAELGLGFTEEPGEDVTARYRQFAIFSRAGAYKTRGLIHGTHRGIKLRAFDCEPDLDKSNSLYLGPPLFSAALAELPAACPPLLIRPESIADRAAALAGFEDIDFESDEFSRRFYVKGPDRKFAFAAVGARAMEFLLEHPNWSIELSGPAAIIHSGDPWDAFGSTRPDPNDPKADEHTFRNAIEVLAGFVELVPHYVWKDLEARVEAEKK